MSTRIKAERARRYGDQQVLPYVVGVMALLIAVLAAHYARTTAEARAQLRFQSQVSSATDSIGRRLAAYVVMLRAGAGLFGGDRTVTRDRFAAYVDSLDLHRQYPGSQGIGLSVRALAGERARLMARAHSQGFPDFKIWPAGPRPEYHAIMYLEPLDRRNRAAVGYDMYTDPVRRAAMERARDTGMPAATGRVTLVQEIDEQKQPGFLIYVPVYRGGRTPATVPERREALEAFVYSPFRAGDLLDSILGRDRPQHVALSVYDGSARSADDLLYHRESAGTPSVPWIRFTTTSVVDVAGRPWSIQFIGWPDPELAWGYGVASMIVLVGVAMSVLLFIVVRTQLQARLHAESSQRQLQETQQRFRRLADTAPVLVWRAGADRRYTFFNRGWLEFTGRELDEQLGERWMESVHPDDRARHREVFDTSVGRGEPFEVEYRLRRADGSYRWMLDRGVPLHRGDGGIGGYIGACVDIEDRKRAEMESESTLRRERASRRQAEELATISRALNETLDLERLGEIIVRSVLDLTGLQVAVLYRADPRSGDLTVVASCGDTGRELIRGMAVPADAATIGQAVRERRAIATPNFLEDPAIRMPATLREKLSRAPYRSVLALPLIAHETLIGALALGDREGRNFSDDEVALAEALASQAAVALENARLFQEGQNARRVAEAANRAKDEFLATVSHELRTPLNAVLGWSAMLARGQLDPEEMRRALDAVQRNAMAQAQLIEGLLDVSRITSGKVRLDIRPVDLGAVVEAALDAVRPAAGAKGVRLQSMVDPTLGPIGGDADRLQQVAWNLLANAVKFTPRAGRVAIRVRPAGEHAELIVSDTGQGIRPETLPHIFERFWQADSGTTRGQGGLGIGLALVRYLVELHGGSVEAASLGEGKGATFTVRFPLLAEGGLERARPPAEAGALDATPGKPQLAGIRVLAVDDHRDSLDLLSAILSPCGAEVRTAASAGEAFAALEAWPADVIVSDIEMPGEDGYSLMRRVRSLPSERGGDIPAVAVTAYGRAEDRRRSRAAGFQQHLTKPTDPAELIAVICTLTGRAPV